MEWDKMSKEIFRKACKSFRRSVEKMTPHFWPAWVGFETAIFWNRRDSTTLSAAPKGDQGWIFWSYKSLSGLPESGPSRIFYLSLIGIILRWGFLIWELIFIYCGLSFFFFSNPTQAGRRFTWSKTWCDRQQLWKAVITGDTVTRLSIPIRCRGKSPEEGQRWNLAET